MQLCLNDPYYPGAPNEEIGTKRRHMKVIIIIISSISITKKKTTPVPISDLFVLQQQDELEHFEPTQGTVDPRKEPILCPWISCAYICEMPPCWLGMVWRGISFQTMFLQNTW